MKHLGGKRKHTTGSQDTEAKQVNVGTLEVLTRRYFTHPDEGGDYLSATEMQEAPKGPHL